MDIEPKTFNVVLLSPDEWERRDLAERLREAVSSLKVLEYDIPAFAQERIEAGDVHLCVVGEKLDIETKKSFIRSMTGGHCAIVSALENEMDLTLPICIRAGAHSVIFRNRDSRRLRRAIRSALDAVKRNNIETQNGHVREQITSVPWLIEALASRLEDVATSLEGRKGNGRDSLRRCVVNSIETSGVVKSLSGK